MTMNAMMGQPAPPNAMVIFGASGDLTKRKLIPALYNLLGSSVLPADFAVIGVARASLTDEQFRDQIGQQIQEFLQSPLDANLWKWLAERMFYVSGDFADATVYHRLRQRLSEVDTNQKTDGNYLYYLATASDFFAPIVHQLGDAGLLAETEGNWRRVIIEKPFGRDLESAQALNKDLSKTLAERQTYRIDHYLGKETVQNLLVFRFGNAIFEPIWNRQYIDHVQITAAETVGVEQRAGYYETSGALRDMMPNHLFQLLSLTTMEPPVSFDADAVRDEQTKILHAIPIIPEDQVLARAIRGQYGPGTGHLIDVPAYRAEEKVANDSRTETFVALKLGVDNWRWAGVPFYLRTGKRLPVRATEITIQFKRVPFHLFRNTPVEKLPTNRLTIQIQPGEGMRLRFGAKVPGPVMNVGPVEMSFDYADYFGQTPSTGYERLLYDCMCGDATLFQRADMVEAAWRVVTPIIDVWKALPPRSFPNYAAGTWGPYESEEMLTRDGREWRMLS